MIREKDKEILLQQLGDRIRSLREERGYSLREASYRCNLDFSDIAKIEKGEKNITYLTLVQLSIAYEVQPRELLNFNITIDPL